jgi:23S rRNA pseudouridine2605 synthase
MLTDDGDLAHVLMHPKYGVEKTYRAVVTGRLEPDAVSAIAGGVRLDDGRTAPARVRIVAASRTASTVDITIHEGKNRQVRRTFETLGHPVLGLTRMRFGPITLGSLGPGEFRQCSERELRALRELAGTPS